MKICAVRSGKNYCTRDEKIFFRAISDRYPGSKILLPRRAFVERRRKEKSAIVGKSDMLIMLEHKGHIDRAMFLQYRKALEMKMPIFVFREGSFRRVRKIRMVNVFDEKVYYARLVL